MWLHLLVKCSAFTPVLVPYKHVYTPSPGVPIMWCSNLNALPSVNTPSPSVPLYVVQLLHPIPAHMYGIYCSVTPTHAGAFPLQASQLHGKGYFTCSSRPYACVRTPAPPRPWDSVSVAYSYLAGTPSSPIAACSPITVLVANPSPIPRPLA